MPLPKAISREPDAVPGSMVWSVFWPLSNIVHLAWESLRVNKVRTGLAALGIAIGVGSVILVVTIALTSRSYVLDQIEGVRANMIFASLQGTDSVASAGTLADALTLDDLNAIRERVLSLNAAAGVLAGREPLRIGNRVREVSVIGTNPDLRVIRNLRVVAGRFFDADDEAQRSRVCLITETLAQTLYPDGWKEGSRLKVRGLEFAVIGVFQEGAAPFGPSELTRETVLIPISVMTLLTGSNALRRIYASTDRPEDVPAATEALRRVLQERHRRSAVYRVENLTGILAAARNIAAALSLVLMVVSVISLVVGGIGIMTIMMVTVTERTREIGLRMAMGATRNVIRLQFLTEAVLISLGGGIVGIAGGAGIPLLVQFFVDGISIPVSGTAIAIAVLVSCLCGMVFGVIPAQRASRLNPTEALRYE